MNKQKISLIGVLLLGCCAVFLWVWNNESANRAEESNARSDKAQFINVSPEAQIHAEIELKEAAPVIIRDVLKVPAKVVLDPNHQAIVTPRVDGNVVAIFKQIGDQVSVGEKLALIESKEFAEVVNGYLIAAKDLEFHTQLFEKEKALFERNATSEVALLESEKEKADAELEFRVQQEKLFALGLKENELQELQKGIYQPKGRVHLTSPIKGTVIDRQLILGERVDPTREAFEIADLSHLAAEISLNSKDLNKVRAGQEVIFNSLWNGEQKRGEIVFVSPQVASLSRAAVALAALKEDESKWYPGSFINAEIIVQERPVPVAVDKSALRNIEGAPVIFVQKEGGFEVREVAVGREDNHFVEITQNLECGEKVVCKGSFVLKAELTKDSEEDD